MPPKRTKRNISATQTSKLMIDLTNLNKDLKPFPHPFYVGQYGLGCQPKTSIELTMMNLSGVIRSKPKWYEKIKDQTIRNKWKQEALEQNLLTEKQIDYVLDELEYYNSIRDGSMEMSTIDGVWQSDQLISNDIKDALIKCVSRLENIPEKDKDWHPGTNQQVLDLVHPSLYCYINEKTRILNDKNHLIDFKNILESIGKGEMININEDQSSSKKRKKYSESSNYAKSDKYQWLPAEFDVSNDGQVSIRSYINNLHPIEYEELYRVIEQIFQCFIPLFNKVLTDLMTEKANRIVVDPYSWYEDSSSSDDDDDDDENEDEDEYNKPITVPDVEVFQMPSVPTTQIDLRGRRLQVIVKLANIVLTPDNPTYPGGVWHVEGMENEHIIATGIYYYHSSNLTQSNLQFRTVIREPDYQQNDYRGVQTVYSLSDEEPLNQNLGELITQENRCITFPNIYQHRVASFQLQDSMNQFGERKILVFFLVDPSLRILSTEHVPPQQSHWLFNIIRNISPFKELPSVVVDKILSYVDYPMNLKEAKEHREKLMEERKYFISQNNQRLFERPFSLCEH